LRLAYLGTSEFAATVLRRLSDSPFGPALVITPPDRKKGRGRKLSPPPVAEAAAELGLELHQTKSVNEPKSMDAIAAAGIDVGMVCAFGQLIKPPLLDQVEMLNVHPSLLPRWRGAAPIERALMAGDEETGVAIMRLTEGLDSGPIALCERVQIEAGEDFGSLSARLSKLGGDLSVQALELRESGELSFFEQSEDGITYAEKIEAADRRLDPGARAIDLERTVRGLTPHVGAFLELEGDDRLGVTGATADDGDLGAGVLEADLSELVLGTAAGTLRIHRVKPKGKREMPAADYLRGNPSPRTAS
jgi:methionyl-tRNA formyltransferase